MQKLWNTTNSRQRADVCFVNSDIHPIPPFTLEKLLTLLVVNPATYSRLRICSSICNISSPLRCERLRNFFLLCRFVCNEL
ncbi:hypothetical protein F2P81_004230 [Scophthalmus maximus]|uniref:Uncharacterized protein n=1 Tax=Scophthalmus maximus TaxID=52904 RepID=A0A6A4TA37_SCOMX|nr:hypothetical protein F2P81_004230 [Scophthalmus maximus]